MDKHQKVIEIKQQRKAFKVQTTVLPIQKDDDSHKEPQNKGYRNLPLGQYLKRYLLLRTVYSQA